MCLFVHNICTDVLIMYVDVGLTTESIHWLAVLYSSGVGPGTVPFVQIGLSVVLPPPLKGVIIDKYEQNNEETGHFYLFGQC